MAILLLMQFKGRCRALLWQNEEARYVCGMVVWPDQYVFLIPLRLRYRIGRLIATRIASGSGCDFAAEVLDFEI